MHTPLIPVREIAEAVQGAVVGNPDLEIQDIRGLEDARPGDISFLSNPKYFRHVNETNASALIVGKDFSTDRSDLTLVVVDDPYSGFIRVLKLLRPESHPYTPGIDPSAVIAKDAVIGQDAMVGPNAVIGSGCTIGDGAVVLANVVLVADVAVGDRTRIFPNVTVYPNCRIGNDVIIHSSTVIGGDGFGFIKGEDSTWEKIPQTGSVVIDDHAEIGACVTIDRGTLGETHIGKGVKLDNLIHIAHNVRIGENTVIAAQTGISGSTMIGPTNMIAGQVGIVGHIETTENVIIEAQSGVSKSILKAGRYFGHPAKEHGLALRQEGALRQLPELLSEIRAMKRQIRDLEDALKSTAESSSESE